MSKLPLDTIDCIDDARMAIEKGLLVLEDMLAEYSFSLNVTDNRERWADEHDRITTYLDIASDYMYKALETLDDVEESSGVTETSINDGDGAA